MCGIFAYSGERPTAGDIVLNGLKKLEYRGYDSWGVAVVCGGDQRDVTIAVHKTVGKISAADPAQCRFPAARIAIGHSRWATHGGVTQENAHPHTDEAGRVAIVHNGIIENYRELKEELAGHTFRSETDTEVIAHVIEERIDQGFEQAVLTMFRRLVGRFSVVAISNDGMMVAGRRGSPLIVGIGDNEFFISSDVPAFLEYTRSVNYLDDNEMVVISGNSIHFVNIETGSRIQKRNVTITWNIETAEKGDHPHYMIKEIREQKDTIHRTMNQDASLMEQLADVIRSAYGIFFVGCGTAGKVCMAAEYLFSEIAKKHVNVVLGSEFRSHQHFLKKGGLFIAVSQSGETADTLEALEVARSKGMTTLAIVNVESSTMARESNYVLPLKVGPEKAVASTKATTAQLALVILLAYGTAGKFKEGQHLLIEAAGAVNDMLNPRYEEHVYALARKLYSHESMYVIGKGVNYPMALEAAIKIQEVSYIHAEGFAGGELKHGPLALIGEGTPVIVLAANDDSLRDTLSNAVEVKARGGYIIGVSPEHDAVFDYWLKVPDIGGPASAILNIVPIQILAYHMGVMKGGDPDHPRNLAKSVTVK